jgi:hypothetical protein
MGVNAFHESFYLHFRVIVTAQRFNQNYSNAASVLFRPGSEADFGSPERTETYVRKSKLESGSGMGKNHVAFE